MTAPAIASSRPVPRLVLAFVRPFREFFKTRAAGGVVLIVATAIALAWANSPWAHSYEGLLGAPVGLSIGGRAVVWPVHHFINDALMSVFFLVAGMEIKRELVVGELRTLRRATLPAIAALGGMLVPAGIHFAINHAGPAAHGWGIPMATDIAFALGCIALVSRRVPSSLVVFLMALAIFDDLGAIVVIALFYGQSVDLGALGAALAITLVLVGLMRARVTSVWPYLVLGLALWLAVLRSGVHATVAGVVLGLTIPARAAKLPHEVLEDLEQAVRRLRMTKEGELDASAPLAALERHLESVQPPLDRMIHGLHFVVAFGIVPLFAVANAGVELSGSLGESLSTPAGLGVALGLFLGKPIGVFGATYLCVRLGFAPKPTGATWAQVFGVGVLAGVGFTMSIFVATLAFPGHEELVAPSKLGIFAASFTSALVGIAVLLRVGRVEEQSATANDFELAIDLPRYAQGFRVEPWVARGKAVGRTLAELDLGRRHRVSAIGAYPADRGSTADRALEPVGAEYRVAAGDTLILVGKVGDIEAFLSSVEGVPITLPPPPVRTSA